MRTTLTPAVRALLASSLLLQSCATIISSPRQSILVSGQPEGSSFYVNDKQVVPRSAGAGAVKLRLKRKGNSEVKIKHEGYKDYNEVLIPDRTNAVSYLNYALIPLAYVGLNDLKDASANNVDDFNFTPLLVGLLAPLAGGGIDAATGANRRFSKTEIQVSMPRLPRAVAGGQSVQAGMLNVRIKGGDKMGNFSIVKEPQEILYFGKTLDVDADQLKTDVNSALKDLGYNVPSAEGKSVFSVASNSRYTLQGEMRDVKYDINATNKYESYAHYETHCVVEVTWKLVNQSRQTIAEQKTSGSSIKFEKGGSAAFEDAFENALYAFLDNKDVVAALSKPAAKAGSAEDKPAAISLHRLGLTKPAAGDGNGVSAAAKAVVIIETSDGHGSGCLVSSDGYIVTNAHVVGDENEVKVTMADGVTAKGKVVRVNSEMDLALVKVEADGLPAFALPAAAMAEVGTDVFAIGAPADKELSQSVTKGIISGRRKVEGRSFLQTDVSINGGNSGGALVARSGQLVGIVNAKLVGRGVEGIGFAIPAEQVSDALQLKYID
ncbi:MAG: S1C family serine protease [Janthinobacterium lividum]